MVTTSLAFSRHVRALGATGVNVLVRWPFLAAAEYSGVRARYQRVLDAGATVRLENRSRAAVDRLRARPRGQQQKTSRLAAVAASAIAAGSAPAASRDPLAVAAPDGGAVVDRGALLTGRVDSVGGDHAENSVGGRRIDRILPWLGRGPGSSSTSGLRSGLGLTQSRSTWSEKDGENNV